MKKISSVLFFLIALSGCVSNQSAVVSIDSPQTQLEDPFLRFDQFVSIEVLTEGATTSGGGVWLGNGEVLTATHLFLGMKSASDPITVTWKGQKFKATPFFHGRPPENDLLLLKIDQSLIPATFMKVRPPTVCGDVEPIGALLEVVTPKRTYPTYASPAGQVRYKGKVWSNSTTSLFSHGVSGSPVYDKQLDCLAGIVSRLSFSSEHDPNDPKQGTCERATLQLQDPHDGTLCAIDAKTIFMTSEEIQKFLSEAKKHESILHAK